MTLSRNEFEVLATLMSDSTLSQRALAKETLLSLGSVNAAKKQLADKGLIDPYGVVTEKGIRELAPYKVDNAVILAAGLSSRFAPISYEKPKGLLKVRGEVLVERQIEQLQAVGIDDITVVVGFKKEFFFYLEDKYGVKIVINNEYASRNNNSSLMVVHEQLGNTYICCSDDYFTVNPFRPYVWKAYYATQYCSGETDEWCVRTGRADRIVDVTIGGCDSWIMLGHVYYDRDFSKGFVRFLLEDYDKPETARKLWEEIYIDHIQDLDMIAKHYDSDVVYEFDTLEEVRLFDPFFLDNVDSEVFENIEATLGCFKNDICDIYPLKQGLTNLSCHFSVNNEEYVYRHPGAGTEEIINRESEMKAQHLAKSLGLDDTFIFENPEKGWKISRFLPNCRVLDPQNSNELARAMEMARKLHESDAVLDNSFDFFDEGKRYESLLRKHGKIEVPGFYEMAAKAQRLKEYLDEDDAPKCLTHNDFFMLNLLIDENDKMYLIDWEYAGMADYANDFATFTVCCQLSEEEANNALALYFGRKPTDSEHRHNFGYVALAGWCWYVWSLFKEAEGENVGEWLYIYYNYARNYMDKVLAWYEAATK